MKELNIEIPEELNYYEYKKQICFFSKNITAFALNGNILSIECDDDADIEKVEATAQASMKKMLEDTKKDIIIEENHADREFSYDLFEKGFVCRNEKGLISLGKEAVDLFDYFDTIFRNIALKLGASEEKYPVLLGINTMNYTGYYRRTPQYTMFCSDVTEDFSELEKMSKATFVKNNMDEVVKKPGFSLSPSACFHVYEKYQNKEIKNGTIITLNQNVFRNEGRLNWDEFGRLRDYHVREIVFFGSEKYVEEIRERISKEIMQIIKRLEINAFMSVAADAFIMPKMIRYKKYQIMERSKYEVRMSYENDRTIAVASLNLHGTAFTNSFNIKVQGEENPVSGCIGFGIERWIMAFLVQYGTNVERWPGEIQQFIEDRKKYEF